MAHVFVLVEAREHYMDLFIQDMTERRYPSKRLDGQWSGVQPNLREIKLFDISVPEETIPYLMSDLAPYATPEKNALDSPMKKLATFLMKGVREFAGLYPIYPEPDTKWKKIPIVGKFLNKVARTFSKWEPKEEYKASGEVRHQWVNVMPVGWKEDQKDPKSTMFWLPTGGELV